MISATPATTDSYFGDMGIFIYFSSGKSCRQEKKCKCNIINKPHDSHGSGLVWSGLDEKEICFKIGSFILMLLYQD